MTEQFSLAEAMGKPATGGGTPTPPPSGPFSLADAIGKRGMGSPTQPAAPPAASIWDRIKAAVPSADEAKRDLAMGVGHVIDGAGGAVGFFANPLNAVVNATGIPQRVTGQPLATDVGEHWSDDLGLPQPQTRAERLIGDVAQGASAGLFTAGGAGAATGAKVAPGIARSFLDFLAEAPVVNTIAGGTGGLATGATREAGGGEVAQALAGLAGGLAGGAAAHIAAPRLGVRPAATPVPELVDAPLDGAPPSDPVAAIAAILRQGGAAPEQFSTPELAAAAAQRMSAAQGAAPNLADGLAGMKPKPAATMLDQLMLARDQGALPPRVVPDDVSMIAAPEGAIRSDDPGAIAGVERNRAATGAVLDEAQRRVADDPVVAHVLDSSLPRDVKVATIWDRLAAAGQSPDDMPTLPFQASTPDAAVASAQRAMNPAAARVHDITMASESGGNPNAVSSKGATGLMQVMPGTARDPGFGVRPSDGTAADTARAGRDYIDALQRHYGGDMERAWAAYNAGPGAVDGAIAKHGPDWLDHMPAETRAYVNKNMAALGGDRGPAPVWRMSAPDDPTGLYSGATRPNEGKTNPGETTLGDFENPAAATSPSNGELAAGVGAGDGPSGASGGSDRLFKSTSADAGFEATARQQAADLQAKAQADLEAEWARRAQEQADRTANAGADARFERERANTEAASAGDPSALYGGKYDQRPVKAGDLWATTEEGYVAGKAGQPVAFRNAREAARWAAGNEMGGDFELATWKANSERVVLRRREASRYGLPEDYAPAAGRSVDDSQRALPAPEVAKSPDAPQGAAIPSETARVDPSRADVAGGAAGVGEPARTGSNARPSAPAGGRAPRLPEDALSFIAKNGGLRNDEGHALRAGGRELAQFAPQGGHVFRKTGMSIDQAGEALHEAGFFPHGRPTTADVLEMLDRSAHERVYRPADVPEVEARRAAQQDVIDREHAAQQVDEAANSAGIELTSDERDGIASYMSSGSSADEAMQHYFMDRLEARGGAAHEQTHEPGYDIPFEPTKAADRDGRQADGGPAGVGGDEGGGSAPPRGTQEDRRASGAAGSDPEPAQPDAFGTRPGDERAALERAAAGRQRADVAQKPPGSDGGLFDDNSGRQADLLDEPQPRTRGEMYADHLRRYREGKTLDAADMDRLTRAGYLRDHPGSDRPIITPEGQAIMRRFMGGSDAGFVTADMLTAPFRAIGQFLFEPDFAKSEGPAMVGAITKAFGDPKRAASATLDRMKAFGEVTAYSADSAMRSIAARLKAPTVEKLADMFHAQAGRTDNPVGRTFAEAVTRNRARFGNDLHEALKPHLDDKASMNRIRDLLATPDRNVRATAAEREAAGKVRDLLAEMLEYRRDAGESIGEVKDGYFPRQLRFDKVAADPEAFRVAAERTYRAAGVEDPKGAAAAWLQNAVDGHLGISDGLTAFGGGSGASPTKAREFGSYADENMRPFYETNPMATLTGYVHGAVKKAETARRFGPAGREGSPERAAFEKQHGEGATQWTVMRDQIKDELRANGADATGIMERLDGMRQTNLGMARPGSSPRVGASISLIHAWNQLGTLAQSTFASLPEMAMGFVRGGARYGFDHFATSMDEFQRNIRHLPPSDAKRYAEAVGAVASDSALDLIRARADDPLANTMSQKLLHQFYRKNGLEQWTDAGRTAAVKTGQRFLATLAGDLSSLSARTKNRAAGYLRELGIRDPAGFAKAIAGGAPSVADIRADTGMAKDYATALLRYANQTVLMPDRSVKPSWASHPVGSLLFALQSYNYAFKKNVLDRAGREALAAFNDRDPAKLQAAAGLAVLTGVQGMVTGLRHLIYGAPAGPDETPAQYALETIDRAGLFGPATVLLNAVEGLRYRRSIGSALQGAVIGRAADAATAIGTPIVNKISGKEPNTNSGERNAAAAVYDMAVKPAIDAIGAGVLRGAAGSAAIMGSGVRTDGGILPSDRGAFVDAAAGPKPEKPGS